MVELYKKARKFIILKNMVKIATRKISPKKLVELFRGGCFHKVIGVEETENIDFKKEPYFLSTEDKKYELAKDVAAIANSGGGIICIGFEEEKDSERLVSYAKTFSLIKNKKDIKLESWKQILKNKIHPSLPDNLVKFEYYSNQDGSVLCVSITDPPKEIMPLLVIRLNQQMEYFVCPFRNGSDTERFLSIDKIHEYISRGYRKSLEGISDLDRIESKIDTLAQILYKGTSTDKNRQFTKEELTELINYSKDKLGYETGYFYIAAYPEVAEPIDKFWNTNSGKAYKLIENPPSLRNMGWDLRAAEMEKPYSNSNRWEKMNGNRKIVVLTRNGVIFSASSIEGFLDWGIEDYSGNEIDKAKEKMKLLNNYALVEYIDNFIHFVVKVKKELSVQSNYQIEFGFSLDKNNIGLFRPPHIAHYFRDIIGPQKNTNGTVVLKNSDRREPRYIAGQIIEEIYASFFGETDCSLAYLESDDKGSFVQEDRYLNQKM